MHFKRHYKNKSEDTLELITATLYNVHMFSATHKKKKNIKLFITEMFNHVNQPGFIPHLKSRYGKVLYNNMLFLCHKRNHNALISRHSLLLLSSTAPPCAKQCPLTYKPRRKGWCHSLTSCLPEQNNEHNWPWQRRFRCRVIGGSHRKDGLDSAFDSNSPWLWRKPVMRLAMREYDPI